MRDAAFYALNRFGLGARPGEVASVGAVPADTPVVQVEFPATSLMGAR